MDWEMRRNSWAGCSLDGRRRHKDAVMRGKHGGATTAGDMGGLGLEVGVGVRRREGLETVGGSDREDGDKCVV